MVDRLGLSGVLMSRRPSSRCRVRVGGCLERMARVVRKERGMSHGLC